MSDNSTPLVSVLMTVYNREKYLKTAIESVLAQTFTDYELIIVDDGSTDRSAEIIESYRGHERVRICPNEKNLKQFRTRNRAAELSRGRYLKYLDSDDAMLPHCLEVMTHMMERHPSAGMLLWSSEGDPWYPFELSPVEIYRRRFWRGQRLERAPLSTMMRKEAFEAVGGFDLNWPLSADMDLIYRLACYFPAIYGPHGLLYYRIHGDQVYSSSSDGDLNITMDEVAIMVAALRHPDCPLPSEERKWLLMRTLGISLVTVRNLAFRHRRADLAWRLLKAVRYQPSEFLPLLSRRPTPPSPPPIPESLTWEDFPVCPPLANVPEIMPCRVSVIVAPKQADQQLRLCLESLRNQRLTALEVLVAVDGRQDDVREQVAGLNDHRFRCLEVPEDAGTWERFNRAMPSASGTYLKFIGPETPILYPYALEIEAGILDSRPGHAVLSAGSAAFTLGGLALTPEEVLALDAATNGSYLRVDPSCTLIRRTALSSASFDSTLAEWALVALLYRLAACSGAILGPYGLSTAWDRYQPKPSGDLPESVREQTVASLRGSGTSHPVINWDDLIGRGNALAATIADRCQWDSPSWVLPDIAASCQGGISCRS